MFDRICLRETLTCPICNKTGPHSRVKSKNKFVQGQAVHGWECESCGSVRTDREGTYPEISRKMRGWT